MSITARHIILPLSRGGMLPKRDVLTIDRIPSAPIIKGACHYLRKKSDYKI